LTKFKFITPIAQKLLQNLFFSETGKQNGLKGRSAAGVLRACSKEGARVAWHMVLHIILPLQSFGSGSVKAVLDSRPR
jgi:carbon monoxide dehydrogenase subunit G